MDAFSRDAREIMNRMTPLEQWDFSEIRAPAATRPWRAMKPEAMAGSVCRTDSNQHETRSTKRACLNQEGGAGVLGVDADE